MASAYRRTLKSGKREKVWRFKYKDYAGTWRYGTGWSDKQKTLNHACDVEAEHRAVRNGEKPLPSNRRLQTNRMAWEVVAAYLAWGETHGGRGGRPWDKKNAALKKGYLNWWVTELGIKALAEVRLDHVERVLQGLLASGEYKPKSVALRLEPLRCLCRWAARRGYLFHDPLAGLAKFDTRPRDPHRALTEDEIGRLLKKAPLTRQLRYEVALATGYRVNELRSLRVRDLDRKGPSLPLGADYTKNRKDARQPITKELADRLAVIVEGRPADAPLLGIPTSKAWAQFQADLNAA